MYTTPTRPYEVYLELQPETRNTVHEVYENVVEDESATDVGVQRVNMGNTNQDGINRGQAPPKTLNASRKDVQKIQRMQLLMVVAVVITFLTAVVTLVFVITIKWPRNTPAVSKQGAEEGTIQELDVEDCATNTQLCNRNAVCRTMEGSSICICNPGYTGNGKICTDINECRTNVHNCDANAFCSNSEGSYNCTCSLGYTGNGASCRGLACPAGWAENGNQCYFILPKEKNAFEGGYLCKQLGATLPIIKSAEENAFLLSLMERKGDPRLGMIAPKGDNVFQWLDGTAVADTFSAWNTSEPNFVGLENCGHLYVSGSGKGKWNNDPCTYSRAIVCQMEKK